MLMRFVCGWRSLRRLMHNIRYEDLNRQGANIAWVPVRWIGSDATGEGSQSGVMSAIKYETGQWY
jgi:hypothetical protein